VIHDAIRGESHDVEMRFPHLGGSSLATHGTCLADETPWVYFCFAVHDRPEVRSQIGSQEPIRIGPPVSLRPLTHTT
jgi:hypothetical protein